MTDWIFAAIAMAALLLFMGIVNVYVMEPDLWVVSLLVLGVAVWYTWHDLKALDEPKENDPDGAPEG